MRCDLALGGHHLHFIGSVINRLGVKSFLYIGGTPVGTVVIPYVRSISESSDGLLRDVTLPVFKYAYSRIEYRRAGATVTLCTLTVTDRLCSP